MKLVNEVRRKFAIGQDYMNFRGIVFFAQRRLLNIAGRRKLARLVSRFLPRPATFAAQQSTEATKLQNDGFAIVEGIVTTEMTRDINEYLTRQPVYSYFYADRLLVSIDDPQLPDSHTFTIPEQKLVSCPHLLDIANHPTVLAAVEGVFECKPTIGYMTAWWSVPTADGKPRHAENFHRDVDDVHFLKLFVYVSDVRLDNGPHEFIRGSHDVSILCDTRRHADDEIISAFGVHQLVRFTGPPGTSFIENTFGLHRGQPVRSGRRLILQIVYSMLPMAYGPAKPYSAHLFAPASVPIDLYVNRVYRSST